MKEPRWVPRLVVEALHLEQVRAHGGLAGLRDEGLLEAALARPRHRWALRKRVDLASLAAAYGYGLARDHPFRDGNKRAAFVTLAVFLGLNGWMLEATDVDVVTVMLGVADGSVTEAGLAKWVRPRLRKAKALRGGPG